MNKETVQEALTKAGHASANDPTIVADITKLISVYEGGKRPYYIYCAATSARLGMSQQAVFDKRLAAFNGDILAMFASYKGRSSGEPKVGVDPNKPKGRQTFNSMAREFKNKPTEKTGIIHEMETTKTDKDGNPTEQVIIITEHGKIIKREVRKMDTVDVV